MSAVDGKLLDCATIPKDKQGEDVLVSIPNGGQPVEQRSSAAFQPVLDEAGENVNVAIVGGNLVGKDGDGAMVDDISVIWTPCKSTGGKPSGGGACAIGCNFESGL